MSRQTEGQQLSRSELRGLLIQGMIVEFNQKRPDPQGNLSGYSAGDLSNIDLRGANFEYLCLNGLNFRGSNLQGVSFKGAELQHCQIAETNLSGTSFQEANLAGACLDHSTLKGTNFLMADLDVASFNGCDLRHCNVEEAISFESTHVYYARLTEKQQKNYLRDLQLSWQEAEEEADKGE